jgi:hypothetical protein
MQRQEILTNGLHNVNKSDVVDVERDDVEEDFIMANTGLSKIWSKTMKKKTNE